MTVGCVIVFGKTTPAGLVSASAVRGLSQRVKVVDGLANALGWNRRGALIQRRFVGQEAP